MSRNLSKQKVLAIYRADGTYEEIAFEYDVSPAHVGSIKRGECHRQITGATCSKATHRLLSPELKAAMLEGFDTFKDRAARLGVARSTVSRHMSQRRKKEA